MRLLLVEDFADLRHLFARILRGSGFDVREAADGLEALACLSGFEPEVVLTDLMMPVMDGFEFIRLLHAIPAFSGVPVLAMTAAATDDAVNEARKAGAADVLAKPLDSQTLLSRLGGICH